ncbi:MAG TPA: TonB family protein, partial [Thermoanaerobaculia bacterium]
VRACLSVRVDEAGNVTDAQVVRADTPEFASACVDALKGWRFEPAKRGSTPVAVTFRLSMSSM